MSPVTHNINRVVVMLWLICVYCKSNNVVAAVQLCQLELANAVVSTGVFSSTFR